MMFKTLSALVLYVGVLSADSPGADSKAQVQTTIETIPLKLGLVNAISGEINLRVPLGPNLPGRIPLGFTWSYNSQDRGSGPDFRPFVWPGGVYTPRQVSVKIGGEVMTFHNNANPTTGLPTQSQILAWMSERHVDDGSTEANAQHQPTAQYPSPVFHMDPVLPSTDGMRFYVETWWMVGTSRPGVGDKVIEGTQEVARRRIVLSGPTANWQAGRVTHITNRWGDHVTATESGGNMGENFQIVIRNENGSESFAHFGAGSLEITDANPVTTSGAFKRLVDS